jgi:hypothetical protein
MTRFAPGKAHRMAATNRTRIFPSVFLLALILAAGSASGAEKARKGASAPVASGGSPLLTPAQLRECVTQKERLHSQTDDALKDKAAIEADKAEIARTGASLGEQLASLDKTSAEAVDAYNHKVEDRDKLIDGYQAKVTAYNGKAETVKTTKETYERTCEGRRYDDRDMNDVKRKK